MVPDAAIDDWPSIVLTARAASATARTSSARVRSDRTATSRSGGAAALDIAVVPPTIAPTVSSGDSPTDSALGRVALASGAAIVEAAADCARPGNGSTREGAEASPRGASCVGPTGRHAAISEFESGGGGAAEPGSLKPTSFEFASTFIASVGTPTEYFTATAVPFLIDVCLAASVPCDHWRLAGFPPTDSS